MKTFPNAKDYHTLLKNAYESALDALTDLDKKDMSMDYRARNVLDRLDEKKIFDPSVIAGIKIAKGTVLSDTRKAYDKIYSMASGHGYVTHQHAKYNPLEGYPLLNGGYGNPNPEHATIYINAVYLSENG